MTDHFESLHTYRTSTVTHDAWSFTREYNEYNTSLRFSFSVLEIYVSSVSVCIYFMETMQAIQVSIFSHVQLNLDK